VLTGLRVRYLGKANDVKANRKNTAVSVEGADSYNCKESIRRVARIGKGTR